MNLKPSKGFLVIRDFYSISVLGWILIDRCGKNFGHILNFLRDGTVPLPDSRREDLLEILTEAKYYCIQQLVEQCELVSGEGCMDDSRYNCWYGFRDC